MKNLSKIFLVSVLASVSLFSAIGNTHAASKHTATTLSAQKYLIAFQQNQLPSDFAATISNAGGKVVQAIPQIGGVEVTSTDGGFLDHLKGTSGIQGANIELIHKLDDMTNDLVAADGQIVTDIPQNADSYWNYQWDMQRITKNGESYQLESGGMKNSNGTVAHKAVVGVIDTGIDANHPDLKANFLGGRNFVPAGVDASEKGDPTDLLDREGHGTHVAGSIAANGKVKGVGPNLGIRSYRVFAADGGAPTSWIVEAILQAANDHVDVINMSIGGFDAISRYSFDGTGSYSDLADALLWKRAINYALSKNVTIVVAAGNETLNLNNPTEITSYMNEEYGPLGFNFKGASREVPGQTPGIITVSSSNKWSTDSIAFYSNYGSSTIDVAAPGGDNGPVYDRTGDLSQRDFHYRTLSTWPTYLDPYFTSNLRGYALLHGTSMASPKVAGIAGVIKAAHPDYTPAQVSALLKQTAIDFGKPGTDELFGKGEANAYNALAQ